MKTVTRLFHENDFCYKFYGVNQAIMMVGNASITETALKSTSYDHVNKNIAYDLMKPFITNGVLVSKGSAC